MMLFLQIKSHVFKYLWKKYIEEHTLETQLTNEKTGTIMANVTVVPSFSISNSVEFLGGCL